VVSARSHRIAALERAHHLVAGVAVVFAVSVTLASCRDILIGDRLDAAADICALLQDCYGEEYRCDVIEADLRNASPEVRANFLLSFKADACLGSCPGARVCLDTEPFCAAGGSCQYDHDCCDWSKGEAACGAGDAEGQCCKPNGVACGEGDLCCDAKCREGSCGGYECAQIDEGCDKASDCCSLYCAEGSCAVPSCSFPGEPCQTVGDCCPPPTATKGEMATLVCESGFCGLGGGPFCLPDGEVCSESSQCCPELGSQCLQAGPELSVCSPLECAVGAACSIEGGCCGGFACEAGVCFEDTPGCSEIGLSCIDAECCPGLGCIGDVCDVPPTCVAGSLMVPADWVCRDDYYNDCSYCDCSCGAHDPDCDLSGVILWCDGLPAPKLASCNEEDVCVF